MTSLVYSSLETYRVPLAVLLIVSGLAGCAGARPMSKVTGLATAISCQPSPVDTTPMGLAEIQGTMRSPGELWALLFFDRARSEEELKVVWRMTGSGQFTVEARHEDGTVIPPTWGPKSHSWSSWQRPGLEWGTGFIFPKSGCWTLLATLGDTRAEIRLGVL